MASLSLFVIERHSKVWLLRLLIHRSHQSKLPILRGMEWKNTDGHSLKCQLLEGFIIRRKVAESSTQLSCHGEFFAVSKRVSAQGVGCCTF